VIRSTAAQGLFAAAPRLLTTYRGGSPDIVNGAAGGEVRRVVPADAAVAQRGAGVAAASGRAEICTAKEPL